VEDDRGCCNIPQRQNRERVIMENDKGIELKNSNRSEESPQPDPEMEAQVTPLHDNVFCRRDDKEEIKGGIIIPDYVRGKRQEATVVALGRGRITDQGVTIPMHVEPGDRVLLPKWGGTEEKIHGVEYSMVKETDILALINKREPQEGGAV